jgi:hypothetical protein
LITTIDANASPDKPSLKSRIKKSDEYMIACHTNAVLVRIISEQSIILAVGDLEEILSISIGRPTQSETSPPATGCLASTQNIARQEGHTGLFVDFRTCLSISERMLTAYYGLSVKSILLAQNQLSGSTLTNCPQVESTQLSFCLGSSSSNRDAIDSAHLLDGLPSKRSTACPDRCR